MSDQPLPYIQRKPGDPITAEDWNEVQVDIKGDIHGQITTAIGALQSVPQSGDAGKFGGKTPDEYAQEIVDRVLHELPKRTGYLAIFKDLKVDQESVVTHKLGACPLTDVYQLDYFRVICSEDDHVYESFVTFFLYHASESKIRFRPEETPNLQSISVPIDPVDGHAYRIPFQTMLKLYQVDYTDSSSLDDVENDFWQAFLNDPNDKFSDDQYCHSPWFDRCCREERTVGYIKGRKEWDDIYFQMRPRKTINYSPTIAFGTNEGPAVWPAPTKIQVVHFDFDTLGLTLVENPILSTDLTSPTSLGTGFPAPNAIAADHLKVMVLLKV